MVDVGLIGETHHKQVSKQVIIAISTMRVQLEGGEDSGNLLKGTLKAGGCRIILKEFRERLEFDSWAPQPVLTLSKSLNLPEVSFLTSNGESKLPHGVV